MPAENRGKNVSYSFVGVKEGIVNVQKFPNAQKLIHYNHHLGIDARYLGRVHEHLDTK